MGLAGGGHVDLWCSSSVTVRAFNSPGNCYLFPPGVQKKMKYHMQNMCPRYTMSRVVRTWYYYIRLVHKYKGASRRAALAARRFARRLHAMSSAVVVFAI